MNTADIHACTYQCDRPICIRRQRDELYAVILLQKPGFTAADMADQYATVFERGRKSVLAEQAAAAPVIDHAKLNELLHAAGDAAAVLQNKAAPLGQETSLRLYAALNAFLATLTEKKR